jgi:peroxiredoxin
MTHGLDVQRVRRALSLALVSVAVVTVAAGCESTQETSGKLRIGSSPPEQEEQTLGFGDLQPDAPTGATVFYQKGEAPGTPQVEVRTLEGAQQSVTFGGPRVTVVFFWTPLTGKGRAAAQYASDLSAHFGQSGVRVIGMAEKVGGSHEQVRSFVRSQGIHYPVYLDDGSAVNRIGRVAGSSGAVPAFALIDQQGRLRFYRKGFSATGVKVPTPEGLRRVVRENAAEGNRIVDYLRKILQGG